MRTGWARRHRRRGGAIPHRQEAGHQQPDPFAALTTREREVLQLMARGLTNQEIARRLFISEHTVKNHVSNIYRKVGSADRTWVVVMAIRAGIARLE
ncbi:MAG: response regulator transcription factor [Firmicutes bacterium]|uniref:Response regulator transcription factor n=1 Tax=Geochorda subterranea TaxID=3109564 RepID=A0ABZ1BTX3_9FIRM|nr:response regulator transcription factor [Limnochorda sp. LNt]NLG70113.1 response regulator transcription factor [Bacillota bacterium]WRP15976.1 response regulator transcription factor [Limnochorda sp. LNt]